MCYISQSTQAYSDARTSTWMNQKGYITSASVYNVRLNKLYCLCYISQSTQGYSDARTSNWMNQKRYIPSA